jgi:hypothetical protein
MRKIVARSNQRSGKKDGSPKPTGAPASVDGAAASRNDEDRRRTLNWMLVTVAVLAAVIVALAGLGFYFLQDSKSAWNGRDASIATFVGSETCAGCHRVQAELWHTSQHKHAMDHATDKSVLGDFSDATFDYYRVKSRFSRKDGKFFVETDGPDGKLAVFEVKYTFGIDPLQQYLIEFPDGRLQALSLAWDSRPKEQGGQHWFHLNPNFHVATTAATKWEKESFSSLVIASSTKR